MFWTWQASRLTPGRTVDQQESFRQNHLHEGPDGGLDAVRTLPSPLEPLVGRGRRMVQITANSLQQKRRKTKKVMCQERGKL